MRPRWEVWQCGRVVARAHTRREADALAAPFGCPVVVMPHLRQLHAFDGDGMPVEGAFAAVPSSSNATCEGCGRGPEPFLGHVRRWACHDGGAGGRVYLCPACLRGNHRLRVRGGAR